MWPGRLRHGDKVLVCKFRGTAVRLRIRIRYSKLDSFRVAVTICIGVMAMYDCTDVVTGIPFHRHKSKR